MWRWALILVVSLGAYLESAWADVRCQTSGTLLQYTIHADLGGGHYDTSFATLGSSLPALSQPLAFTTAGASSKALGVACPGGTGAVVMTSGDYQMLIDGAAATTAITAGNAKLDDVVGALDVVRDRIETGNLTASISANHLDAFRPEVSAEFERMGDLGLAGSLALVFLAAFVLGYRFANRGGDV